MTDSKPNLQNFNQHTETGRIIRKAFTSPEGSRFIEVDYTAIEQRMRARAMTDQMTDTLRRMAREIARLRREQHEMEAVFSSDEQQHIEPVYHYLRRVIDDYHLTKEILESPVHDDQGRVQ